MKRETSVALTIEGKAYQFDVSRYTTCDDIIKMAKKSVSSVEENSKYDVYESAFGVFKLLPGNTKILRQIRSWGISSHNFSLELRKSDRLKSKMASISRAKKSLQRLRTLIMKHELNADRKLETYINNNFDLTVYNKDKHYEKNITVIDKEEHIKLSSDVNIPVRTQADGHENVLFVGEERKPGVGEESDDDFSVTENGCSLNCGFISEDTEIEHFDYKDDLNECVIYENDDLSLVNEEIVLDDEDIIDELEINILDHSGGNKTLNLNDCVIYEDDDGSSTDYESAFEDDSDCESIFELERNVLKDNTTLKLNQIKTMFSKGDIDHRISDDDLIDSFMLTFIENEESDEGMESDCSEQLY